MKFVIRDSYFECNFETFLLHCACRANYICGSYRGWGLCRELPRILVLFLFVTAALSLGIEPASAQVTAGLSSISGTVNDASGAVVPDAQVVIANDSNGVHLTLTTTGGGVFNAPSLPPTSGYTVTVDKSGFSEYQVKDMTLSVGQDLNLVVPLAVSGANQTVEVVGTAPLVDDTKTDVSQVIDTQQILDLPINGRRVDTFRVAHARRYQ